MGGSFTVYTRKRTQIIGKKKKNQKITFVILDKISCQDAWKCDSTGVPVTHLKMRLLPVTSITMFMCRVPFYMWLFTKNKTDVFCLIFSIGCSLCHAINVLNRKPKWFLSVVQKELDFTNNFCSREDGIKVAQKMESKL